MLAMKLLTTLFEPEPPVPLAVSLVNGASFEVSSECKLQLLTIQISVTGGVAPYGFLWSKVSGDGVNIIDGTEQNARVQAFTCPNDFKTGRYSVTVQDSALESVTGTFDVSWEKVPLE